MKYILQYAIAATVLLLSFSYPVTAGAAPLDEVAAVKKKIDPENKMSETERSFAALWHVYSFYLDSNELDKAKRAAESLVGLYRMASNRYQAITNAAADRKDLSRAVKAILKEYANVPDGSDHLKLTNEGGRVGYSYTDVKSGKTVEKGISTPAEIMQWASTGGIRNFDSLLAHAGEQRRAGDPEAAPAQSSSPSPTNNQKSEVRSGTGFFVSNDGYLITNEHVVKFCEKLQAFDGAGQQFPVSIVRASKSDDLALLKADTKRTAVAVFRESAKIGQGEAVFMYGYPLAGLLASSGNVATGVVTALAGLRDDARQMQISAPVQQGNSGGPLVDARGAVVGVVVSKLNAVAVAHVTADIPQNVNFAIKASAVTNLLDANSVKYRNDVGWWDLSVETLTRQMKEYTVKIECNLQ